jgi:hypothetical protein
MKLTKKETVIFLKDFYDILNKKASKNNLFKDIEFRPEIVDGQVAIFPCKRMSNGYTSMIYFSGGDFTRMCQSIKGKEIMNNYITDALDVIEEKLKVKKKKTSKNPSSSDFYDSDN